MITQKRLKELLSYDHKKGVFVWLYNERRNNAQGKIAGSFNCRGYRRIKIDNKQYSAHRLAFLYMEGSFPPDQVDHINRIKSDNRWCNLRHADYRINSNNRSSNNAVMGVSRNYDKWIAYTSNNKGIRKNLGTFKYYLQACAARFEWEAISGWRIA